MHARPEQTWTVQSLARLAGMSRSAFSTRFRDVVGQTPLEYLTRWRVHCATRLMQQRNIALADVGRQVGYESAAAFNRVFKRETGMTPGAFRKSTGQDFVAHEPG